ncbi:MAG: hypothetical protein COV69_01560 [Parcubacteria group bacterium CG11_big_fil_rev_8_21_14_0_20_39_14]|nr:MAG: hypothetical protein COV69_01560 [Parcubacteria group bacterium CG11_big_fil_rev_8_21_14_0_20_39_14]PIS35295.1 MAG: hypothetical protein COT36_03180 [Parcubacteria group bacterium CG08_land_8_20_14_0_20_38_56]
MALIPWQPFGELDKFFDEELNWHPIVPFKRFKEPAMDVYQTDKDVIVEISVPGYDPKKVNIEVKDNVLHLEGKMEKEEEEKGKDYYRKEIRRGSFFRVISLPVAVKEDKAEAHYEDGILKVVIPKKEVAPEKKGKKIQVQIKKKKD